MSRFFHFWIKRWSSVSFRKSVSTEEREDKTSFRSDVLLHKERPMFLWTREDGRFSVREGLPLQIQETSRWWRFKATAPTNGRFRSSKAHHLSPCHLLCSHFCWEEQRRCKVEVEEHLVWGWHLSEWELNCAWQQALAPSPHCPPSYIQAARSRKYIWITFFWSLKRTPDFRFSMFYKKSAECVMFLLLRIFLVPSSVSAAASLLWRKMDPPVCVDANINIIICKLTSRRTWTDPTGF